MTTTTFGTEHIPNGQLAGKFVHFDDPGLHARYPAGVYFTLRGYPDFVPYARAAVTMPAPPDGMGVDEVRVTDILAANEVASNSGEPIYQRRGAVFTPEGWVWHHVENSRTLLLVPSELHAALRHHGGVATLQFDRGGRPGLWHSEQPPHVSFSRDGHVPEDVLRQLESHLGHPLPAPYRAFLGATNGGAPLKPAVNTDYGFVADQQFFGLYREEPWQGLTGANARLSDRFTGEYLAIAHVQGGMLLIKVLGESTGSVWYWDDDDPRDEGRDPFAVCGGLLYPVGDNFNDFARRLVEVPPKMAEIAHSAVEHGFASLSTETGRHGMLLPLELQPGKPPVEGPVTPVGAAPPEEALGGAGAPGGMAAAPSPGFGAGAAPGAGRRLHAVPDLDGPGPDAGSPFDDPRRQGGLPPQSGQPFGGQGLGGQGLGGQGLGGQGLAGQGPAVQGPGGQQGFGGQDRGGQEFGGQGFGGGQPLGGQQPPGMPEPLSAHGGPSPQQQPPAFPQQGSPQQGGPEAGDDDAQAFMRMDPAQRIAMVENRMAGAQGQQQPGVPAQGQPGQQPQNRRPLGQPNQSGNFPPPFNTPQQGSSPQQPEQPGGAGYGQQPEQPGGAGYGQQPGYGQQGPSGGNQPNYGAPGQPNYGQHRSEPSTPEPMAPGQDFGTGFSTPEFGGPDFSAPQFGGNQFSGDQFSGGPLASGGGYPGSSSFGEGGPSAAPPATVPPPQQSFGSPGGVPGGVTRDRAMAIADEWINSGMAPHEREEIRVHEFGLGYVVWGVRPGSGPDEQPAAMAVIDRQNGDLTMWPSLAPEQVAAAYERKYHGESPYPSR